MLFETRLIGRYIARLSLPALVLLATLSAGSAGRAPIDVAAKPQVNTRCGAQ